MKTRLIQTKEYLLLIDEEAEIKEGDYYLDGANRLFTPEHNFFAISSFNKVIAYYPLSTEAKELDLPLLPNPFKERVDIRKIALSLYKEPLNKEGEARTKLVGSSGTPFGFNKWFKGFKAGFKASQSKQFSLEDIKKAFNAGGKHIYECEANGKDKKCYCRNDNDCNQRNYITAEEYAQSLSTQQLPKEFVVAYERVRDYDNRDIHGDYSSKLQLKTITNSEGKQELVGTYKY